MKYYFITDISQTFISGPFITVENSQEKYVGQIVRSNDFSVKIQNNDLNLKLCLWSCDFEPTLSYQIIKTQLLGLLSKLDESDNIQLVVKFENPINYSSGPYPSLKTTKENVRYVIEFKCLHDVFYCPTLYVYF
jgi:hypothetical protein